MSTTMSTIESVLNESRVFPPSGEFVKQANISGMAAYQALCDQAECPFCGRRGHASASAALQFALG
jgi:hypothetical protein